MMRLHMRRIIRRRRDMSAEAFRRDAEAVTADLERLKACWRANEREERTEALR